MADQPEHRSRRPRLPAQQAHATDEHTGPHRRPGSGRAWAAAPLPVPVSEPRQDLVVLGHQLPAGDAEVAAHDPPQRIWDALRTRQHEVGPRNLRPREFRAARPHAPGRSTRPRAFRANPRRRLASTLAHAQAAVSRRAAAHQGPAVWRRRSPSGPVAGCCWDRTDRHRRRPSAPRVQPH